MEQRISRITGSLTPVVVVEGVEREPTSLAERMKQLGVPGVGIALIQGSEIEWARGFGLADLESNQRVTTDTLFQAASISKPVASLAVLALVDEGMLDLDAPVNDVLESWRVPDNELTARTAVSLRHLLTHTAGLTVRGFPGYGPGEQLPSTVAILMGHGNTGPVRVVTEPGTTWRYSGGGTTVAQLVVEDVTGRPFEDVMADTVLGPLEMDRSSYAQPLAEELRPRAATGYRSDGSAVDGRFHSYPEQAAAGLWTTPSDLAKYLIAAQHGWRTGDHPVLSAKLVREMLTPGMGRVGLGPAFSEDGQRFGFSGSNAGFRCEMTAFLKGAQGAVVMTNSDNGRQLIDEIVLTIAAEYGWSSPKPMYKSVVELSEADWAALEGVYHGSTRKLRIDAADGRLLVEVTRPGAPVPLSLEWWPESRTAFFGSRRGNTISVVWNEDGTVGGLKLAGHEFRKVE